MPRRYFPFIGVIFVHIGLIASALVIVRCIRDPLRPIIKSCQPPAEYPIGQTHLQGATYQPGTARVVLLRNTPLQTLHRCSWSPDIGVWRISRCTAADEIVSKDNVVLRVSYGVAPCCMGQKVHSVAKHQAYVLSTRNSLYPAPPCQRGKYPGACSSD